MSGKRMRFHVLAGLSAVLMGMAALGTCAAQQSDQRAPQQDAPKAFYQVTLVGRSLMALNYQHRSGSTMIDFAGTPLLPLAKGQATVESKQGRIQIDAKFNKLAPAQKFGAEYLTYVLWAVTPEGKPSNLGEVLLNGTNSKISVTTPLQSFGLLVTAEPYFAVSQPSEVVVLENAVRLDTQATSEQVSVNYELIQRGHYEYDFSKGLTAAALNPNTPIELFEARNAVGIAQQSGADKYAGDTFRRAQSALAQAEEWLRGKADKKQIVQVSREAVQTAADARTIALKREDDERAAQEKAAAQEQEARAKAEADAAAAAQREAEIQRLQAEAQQRQAELDRQKAEAQQKQAELDRAQAEQQRLAAERDAAAQAQARAEADAQRLAAERDAAAQTQARAQAEAATKAALEQQQAALEAVAKAEREKAELRAALLDQFNRILPTRDTPRGLMVNIADVLFDTAKFDLRPPAREALAKLSGIVLAHPGLALAVEGHTDSTGTHEFNQKLSGQRADSVRSYLVQQGLVGDSITATGFAETMPVAENNTALGRQQNRRVEIIISGEVIGTKISAVR